MLNIFLILFILNIPCFFIGAVTISTMWEDFDTPPRKRYVTFIITLFIPIVIWGPLVIGGILILFEKVFKYLVYGLYYEFFKEEKYVAASWFENAVENYFGLFWRP